MHLEAFRGDGEGPELLKFMKAKQNHYFTKTKYMNNYAINFDESEYKHDPELEKNVTGYYNKKNFEANKQFSSVENLKNSLKVGV